MAEYADIADANGNVLSYYYNGTTGTASVRGLASVSDNPERAGHLIIPATITDANSNEHAVTEIFSSAFQNNQNVLSVIIPNSVTNHGSYTFYGCSNLTSVTLGDGLTNVGNLDFYECRKLSSVTLGANITDIGTQAFYNCKALTTIDLRNKVKVLNDYAFYGCSSLSAVLNTDAVTTVKIYAFSYCLALTELTMGEALTSWSYQSPYNGSYRSDYDLANLQHLTLKGMTNPFLDSNSSGGLCDGLLIYVPAAMLETYRADANLSRLRFIAIGSQLDYNVTTTSGGELQEKIEAQCSSLDVVELTVNGPINGTDIEYIHRNLTNLGRLDLSGAQIVNGGDSYHRWQQENGTVTQYGSNSYNTQLNIVGDYMFANLTGLEHLALPSGVTAIGAYAFADCARLTSLTIPDCVTSIGNYAFSYSLSSNKVNILKTLHLPTSLTSLGKYAFRYQKTLQHIEIPGSLETIPEHCFDESSIKEVVLGEGVSVISSRAFINSALQTINLPSTLTLIGESAFSGCDLRGPITLPAALTTISSNAFSSCKNLDNVTFSEGLQTMDTYAFYNCRQLKHAILPSTLKTIGSYAFYQCYRLEDAQLPAGLETLGDAAFYDCDSLTTFTFPEGITIVPNSVLNSCEKLATVQLASGTTRIGNSAFQYCANLATFDFNAYASLTQIDNYAFYGTGLVNVELPDQIVLMGQCFQNCHQLKSINVPTATTYVPSNFVSNCEQLTDVQLHSGITSVNGSAFSGCSSLETLDLPDGITRIGSSAFNGCTKLQFPTLPSSLTTIENSAFEQCKALTQVILPTGLKTIGNYAFESSGVRTAVLPTGLTSFGHSVFYYCDSLRTVSWPDDLTTVPSNTFYSCDSLKSIVLSDAVTTIESNAFFECAGLDNDFHFPASLRTIGYQAFRRTYGLTDITLPISLRTIEGYAFQGSKLKHIEIPDSVTTLGSYAFQACDSLRTAVLGRSMDYTNSTYFDYFNNCNNLRLLRIFAGTPPTINGDYYINSYYKDCVLEVPTGVDELYRASDYWKDFKEIRTFITGDKLDPVDFAIMQRLYELWDGANWTHPWDLETDDRFVGKWHGVTFEGDHIKTLNLTACNLRGPLTHDVFDLPALTSLDLGNNYLTAQLDTVLADNFEDNKMTRIQLYANMLEGDLAPFASKFHALTYLSVAYNQLTAISQPIPRTTLRNVGSELWYDHQFCDYKTGLPFVSEKYPLHQVRFGEPLNIEWNSLQTYQHSSQDYNNSINYLYHIYRNTNKSWTYDSYYIYRGNNGELEVTKDYVIYPLRDTPMLLAPSTSSAYVTPIVVQLTWDEGDVNADMTVDVADLQHIVSFASTGNKLSGKIFNFTAADVITDETIDVRDIVKNVDAILSFEEEETPANTRPYINHIKARTEDLSHGNVIAIEGDCLRLANEDAVAALQLTIEGQRADDLTLAPALRGFAMSKRQVGNDARVVIYHMNGRTIGAGAHDLLMGLAPQAVITNARLTDSEANYLTVAISDCVTGIEDIKGQVSGAEIFDLNGQRIQSLEQAPAGVYVIQQGNKRMKVRK